MDTSGSSNVAEGLGKFIHQQNHSLITKLNGISDSSSNPGQDSRVLLCLEKGMNLLSPSLKVNRGSEWDL